jgi:hypothetical protein
MSATLTGDAIDNTCAVFIARRVSDGALFVSTDTRGAERAVVLETREGGDGKRVLIVAPDATDTIETVAVDGGVKYPVDRMNA